MCRRSTNMMISQRLLFESEMVFVGFSIAEIFKKRSTFQGPEAIHGEVCEGRNRNSEFGHGGIRCVAAAMCSKALLTSDQ